jgi:hypothetical protein
MANANYLGGASWALANVGGRLADARRAELGHREK